LSKITEYCPRCDKEIERDFGACGCGFCPECNYRFVCMQPISYDVNKFTKTTIWELGRPKLPEYII
jgi:hypothetical protein